MAATLEGRIGWKGGRTKEGHKEFTVIHRVRTDSKNDGPAIVMACPGLPTRSSIWAFGNEIALWAMCTGERTVEMDQVKEGRPGVYWRVEDKFSTDRSSRERDSCQGEDVEDPLLEPQKISGSFAKRRVEATTDKDGKPILSISFERLTGPAVEFDESDPAVTIEQNVADLDLETIASMDNTVNDAPLWGLAARCIKLSVESWSRKPYGTCSFYYTRQFRFDIKYDTFDREVPSIGHKALDGYWVGRTWELNSIEVDGSTVDPDPNYPSDFTEFRDRNDDPGTCLHKSDGTPAQTDEEVATITVQKYAESNFLLLGIPTSL